MAAVVRSVKMVFLIGYYDFSECSGCYFRMSLRLWYVPSGRMVTSMQGPGRGEVMRMPSGE